MIGQVLTGNIMSFFDDTFDKHHQQRPRANIANQRDSHPVQEEMHFQKHREWMGEWRDEPDPGRTRRHHEGDSVDHSQLLRRIMHNKTLLVLGGLILIVVLGLSAAILVYALPMILKLFGAVDLGNGQGLLDQAIAMIQKLLASGKII
jgi:hypothetical protein